MFTLGVTLAYLHQPKNQANHYVNLGDTEAKIMQIRITESPKPNLYYQPYLAEVENIFSEKRNKQARGKILLNISKDSLNHELVPGMKFLVPYKLTNITEPLNPYRFNYRNYMQKQRVENQLQILNSEIKILNTKTESQVTSASKLRTRIITKFFATKIGKNELAIMQALLLGQREDISKNL